jgi:hypothetical protein
MFNAFDSDNGNSAHASCLAGARMEPHFSTSEQSPRRDHNSFKNVSFSEQLGVPA